MYAVIGPGPMGLAAARTLQKHRLPFTGFESHGDVGGLWDITNPQSTVYESAHLISSKRMTEFAEFPMRDDVAPYPRHDELRRYFAAYESVAIDVYGVESERAGRSAHARCVVEFSGQARKVLGFEGLLPPSAVYRFDLDVAEEGATWRVRGATWAPAEAAPTDP